MQKRGYFFTLDALLALGILSVGLILLFVSYGSVPQQIIQVLPSQDIMAFLSTTKISDVNNPYVGLGGELWQQGLIPRHEMTLLEELGYLHSLGYDSEARSVIGNVTQAMIPLQYGFELWMDDVLLFPNSSNEESKNATSFFYPSRKLIYGFSNEELGEMFGPYVVEVFLWQQ